MNFSPNNLIETFFKKGYAHVLYALLIEGILLIFLSFSGLFTLETILPGIISGRFIIGKLIIIATTLLFFAAFLGRMLGISFSLAISRSERGLIIGSLAWILGIAIISLLAFPIWSIPIFLITFSLIGYFSWTELKN